MTDLPGVQRSSDGTSVAAFGGALSPVRDMNQAAEAVAKIAMLDSQTAEIEQTAKSQNARTAAWRRRETDAIAAQRARLVASLEPWAWDEIERQQQTRQRSSVTLPWGDVQARHAYNAGLTVTDEAAAINALQDLLPDAIKRSVLVSEVGRQRKGKENPEGRVTIREGRVFVDGELVPGIEWREAGPRVIHVSPRDTPLMPGDG